MAGNYAKIAEGMGAKGISVEDPNEIKIIANNVGYPLMIKATAGGGGTHTMAAESFGPDLEEPKKVCFFYSRLQHRTTKAGASNSGTPPPSPSPACQRIATMAWRRRRRRRPRELQLRNCASIGHHISLSI